MKSTLTRLLYINIAMNVMSNNDHQELMIIEDFRQRNDWPK